MKKYPCEYCKKYVSIKSIMVLTGGKRFAIMACGHVVGVPARSKKKKSWIKRIFRK